MVRPRRVLRYVLVGLAVVFALIAVGVYILTHTDFGVRQAGRLAVDQLRSSINGELRLGSVTSRGLLHGVTLRDVAIDDNDGRPFIRADSATLAYHIRTLIGGNLAFDRLTLFSPRITIERLPGRDKWNYETVFPGDTTAPDTTATPGRLVLINDISVVSGEVVVRTPWQPSGPVQPSDTARLILEDVPGGVARTIRIDHMDARLPRIVWETPDQKGHLIEVGSFSGLVHVWKTPAEVRDLTGTVTLRDSVVSFDMPQVRLPSSSLAVVGNLVTGDAGQRYDIRVTTDQLAFADVRWLNPSLPEDGGGKLDFRLQTRRPGSTLFLVRDARIHTGDSQLAGSFGIVTGDTLYFTDVDLRASPLNVDLLRSLVPMDLPIDGLLIGTVQVEGPVSALDTRGDLRWLAAARDSAPSTVRWRGRIRAREPYGATALEASVADFDLARLARAAPELRVRGIVNGRFNVDGSPGEGMSLDGEATLRRGGETSSFQGGGRLLLARGRSAVDLRLKASPVALELLGAQFPTLVSLTGEATGQITLAGPLDSLQLGADLLTSAGRVAVTGHASLEGETPRYAMRGEVTDFSLDRLLRSLPETQVTATFQLDGRGSGVADADTRLAVNVASARVAGVPVSGATGLVRVDHGLVVVDSFLVRTGVGDASASGSFGLVEGRSGELRLSMRADSVAPLEPVLFRGPGDHAVGEPLEERLAGRATVEATVRGGLSAWSAHASGAVDDLVYDDVRARRGRAEIDAEPGEVTVRATIDSLRAAGRVVPSLAATVRYGDGAGIVDVSALGLASQQLDASGEFRLMDGGAVRLAVARLDLGLADGRWSLADTARATVSRRGLAVDSLVLARSPSPARIRVAGVLPWRDTATAETLPASLALDLDRVQMGELLRLTQTDTVMDGVVSGRFRVTGTASSPVVRGWVTSSPFRYQTAMLDSAGGELRYDDRLIAAHFAGWRAGDTVVTIDASVPADLALAATEQRMLEQPLDVRVRGENVPAGLLSFLTPGFSGLTGRVDAAIDMVGTSRSPALQGELRLSDASAFFEPLLVRYTGVDAVARMRSGRQMELTATLRTGSGSADVNGSLDLTHPGDPGFDLDVTARKLEASRRRDVAAVTDGTVHVGGRYRRPVVSGDLRVVRGEMNLDEIWRQYQIVQLDTSLFELFDSTTVSYRPKGRNPFLDHLLLTNLNVTASREMWLRSQELDVEVSGDLGVEADLGAGDLRLTGALQTVRGTYDLQLAQRVQARRFDIRSGTIEFVGTPGIDPNLDVQAAYRVRRAQGDPIDVVAVLTGTLQEPRVRLTTDSDLQVSQSDLASYLVFGRSGAELTQAESDALSSSAFASYGLGFVRPMLTGFASSELQRVASNLTGSFIDYVALRAPEYQLGDYGSYGLLANTQVEVGFDATSNLTVIGSVRIPAQDAQQPWARLFGARVQYRFLPTWTGEFYLEDRFARTPSFGLAEIDDRKVWGVSLVREWGY